MTDPLVWNDRYELGHPEIDNQHSWLFKTAERVRRAKGEEAKEVVMDLYRYTHRHFKTEEELMKKAGYPNLLEHQELHESLIENLNDLKNSESNQDGEGLADLLVLLMDWVRQHILVHDIQFVEFCKKESLTKWESFRT